MITMIINTCLNVIVYSIDPLFELSFLALRVGISSALSTQHSSVVEGGGGGVQKLWHRARIRRMRAVGWRRRRWSLVRWCLRAIAAISSLSLLILTLRSVEPSSNNIITTSLEIENDAAQADEIDTLIRQPFQENGSKGCATVEEMGEIFSKGFREESLRARRIIHDHFELNGAERVRDLPSEVFCKHGFVLGKASEAGFGNEMYKILSAAALSVMLNRSLIIGQTRGKYPFGDYISYSNITFTLKEVKHLWRQNGCVAKHGRHLVTRTDDFLKPTRTNVLCSDWREWDQPIIWFQNTTDAVAAQFFLKNVHEKMREAALNLFGNPEDLRNRPNVFGELMRILISPSEHVEKAVEWALSGRDDPDIAVHMRMLMNRSIRAVHSVLDCIRKAIGQLNVSSKLKVVVVSDTPSTVKDIVDSIEEFAEVIRFDYEHFERNRSGMGNDLDKLKFRVKDWGPAPRWVAFVDFFLASRVKNAIVSGAHRRVGTTYAQLIAALAAAHRLEENTTTGSSFTYLSSFQSNLLSEGLKRQVGWGHVWNRFAGPLSCSNQSDQCALTPILPPAWWDGLWQSPIPRDVHRMEAYGVQVSGLGIVDADRLQTYCGSRKNVVEITTLI